MVTSAKVEVNGIRIRESITGDGAPALLVHGWGASIDLLTPLALHLSRLGHRCYSLDLPGFGESDEPPDSFTIFDYAAFCLAYLDRHQLGAVNYFGHSLGGRIGLILGADHSNRIAKLALSNSAGIKTETPLGARLRLRAYQSARQSLERIGVKSASEKLREKYNRRFGSDDYRNASPIMRQTLINIVNEDLLKYAKRVAVPTILVWGDNDEDTPLWMGQKLEKTIPDAAMIVHSGAGHYAYLDYPEKTASIIDALYRSK